MLNCFHRVSRRLYAFLAAGMLLQGGGCAVDATEVSSQLITAVVNNFIASYIFGAFNLGGP